MRWSTSVALLSLVSCAGPSVQKAWTLELDISDSRLGHEIVIGDGGMLLSPRWGGGLVRVDERGEVLWRADRGGLLPSTLDGSIYRLRYKNREVTLEHVSADTGQVTRRVVLDLDDAGWSTQWVRDRRDLYR